MRIAGIVFCLLLSPVFIYSQNIDLDRGLIAYYPFDEGANDISGNGNDGEVNGANHEPNARCEGGAYRFDGIENYIDFGNDATLNSDFRGLTISLMVNHTEVSPSDYRLLLGKWAFNKNYDQFALFLNGFQTGLQLFPRVVIDNDDA